MQLILASKSPFRRQLLERLRVPFSLFDPDVDETAKPGEKVTELVIRLAKAKAHAYVSDRPSIIIGADQAGFIHGHMLNKPATIEQAKQQLMLVSGKVVHFHTGVCLHNQIGDYVDQLLHTTKVHFRQLSYEEISNYVDSEQPLHACGSFQVEGLGIALINKIESDDPTGLVGLPLIHLAAMLRKAGLAILGK